MITSTVIACFQLFQMALMQLKMKMSCKKSKTNTFLDENNRKILESFSCVMPTVNTITPMATTGDGFWGGDFSAKISHRVKNSKRIPVICITGREFGKNSKILSLGTTRSACQGAEDGAVLGITNNAGYAI